MCYIDSMLIYGHHGGNRDLFYKWFYELINQFLQIYVLHLHDNIIIRLPPNL